MKVIGSARDGYIVEITKYEARRLFGSSTDEARYDVEYDINRTLQALDTLRRLDELKIKSARYEVQTLLDKLDEISNTVQALTLFDTLSTTEEN